MAATTGDTFSCEACGKKYVWKPELAGKLVKCKCGQSISVPATGPLKGGSGDAAGSAPAPGVKPGGNSVLSPGAAVVRPVLKPAEGEEEDLYDLAEDPVPAAALTAADTPVAAAVFVPFSVPGLEDDLYQCPSCEAQMQPGAVVCSQCGFNLKTGEKVNIGRPAIGGAKTAGTKGTGGAGAKSSAVPPAFSGIPVRKKPQVVEDKKGQLVMIGAAFGLILAIVGAVFVFKLVAAHTHIGSPASSGKGDDPEVVQKMEDENPKEVHEWFKQNPSRMMGELSERQAIGKADELVQMGAKKCYAFGSLMSLCMAVELPDNPEQRKAIIDARNKWNLERRTAPVKDEGQKYVVFNFNP